MRMDWKRVFMANIVLAIILALLLAPIAMAAGAGSSGSSGQGGSSGSTGGHGASSASERSATTGAGVQAGSQSGNRYGGGGVLDKVFWPNGPAGAVPAQNSEGAHHTAWIGGLLNPWTCGGSGMYGAGVIGSLAWPGAFYGPGNYWRTGWPPVR